MKAFKMHAFGDAQLLHGKGVMRLVPLGDAINASTQLPNSGLVKGCISQVYPLAAASAVYRASRPWHVWGKMGRANCNEDELT